MNFLSLNTTPNPVYPPISCFRKTIFEHAVIKPIAAIPARDRAIDFGKYKGKMLGTLPSKYLKWVSKNLRARDFEEWAKLADEVLEDPVYRDRIEWESAQKILNGDVVMRSSSRIPQNAVSELLDISEKFGWDNEDKLGWAKIDFGLLGTSKGGRIPRRLPSSGLRPNDEGAGYAKPKLGNNQYKYGTVEKETDSGDKRRERRERLRLRKRGSNLIDNGEKSDIRLNDKGSFGTSSNNKMEGKEQENVDADAMKMVSPFPGRESLIKKVLGRRR